MKSKDLAAQLQQCREAIAQQDREFDEAAALTRAYPDVIVGVAAADLAALDDCSAVEPAPCPVRCGAGLRC